MDIHSIEAFCKVIVVGLNLHIKLASVRLFLTACAVYFIIKSIVFIKSIHDFSL
jgi:hypothetical protein